MTLRGTGMEYWQRRRTTWAVTCRLKAILMLGACALLSMVATSSARAERGGPQLFHQRGFDVSGNVAFVSDYLFRGQTLSGGKPAIQGGFDYEHRRGPFAGTWASSGSKQLPLEIDLYGGYAPRITDDFFLETSLTGFIYPHNLDENTLEVKLAINPRILVLAYHYDFVLEQQYFEGGVRLEPAFRL